MSVIIRLQNLPWSANAMDIRTFFRGLSIPEGGVHIVGGEQGDAFIAFSTDEDARQAMMNDGGKIKEVQVKLLLSSRSEMHKVIESARQSVSFLQLSQPVVTSNVQHSVLPSPITGLLAQNIKQNMPLPLNLPSFPMTAIEPITMPSDSISSVLETDKEKESRRIRDSKGGERKSIRSRSKSRDRDKKDRNRDKKDKRERSRSRDRSRDRDRRRRDRSRSRDRRDRKRDRKDRSRSRDRDRSKDNLDPRLQRKDDKKNDIPMVDIDHKNQMPKQLNNFNNNKSKEGLLGDFPLTHPDHSTMVPMGGPRMPFMNPRINSNSWSVDMPVPNSQSILGNPPNARLYNADNNIRHSRFSDNINVDQMHRLQELDERRNPNAFQTSDMPNFAPRNSGSRVPYNEFPPTNRPHQNYTDKNISNHDIRNRFQNNIQGFCVKVQNLLTSAGYGDIRRFFAGNFISNQGLKIINNENGKRSGTALVKFFKIEGKQNAMRKNGEFIKGRPVTITHLDDEEFEHAVDSYRPAKESEDSGEEGDSQKSLVIAENIENDEKDDTFKILILEDLPAFAKEHDIMKMFSDYSLLSIFIIVTKDVRKQYIAYVQFVNADDAKAALNNKTKHLIGHKAIKVSPCSEATFELVKIDQNNITDNFSKNDNVEIGNEEHYSENDDSPQISRDPRQRRFDNRQDDMTGSFNKHPKSFHGTHNQSGNPRFPWRNNLNNEHTAERDHSMPRRPPMIHNNYNNSYVDNQILNCAFLRGLPLRTDDRDILDFFSDVGVIPIKTHLMLTIQGQPSGDCFCEFMEAEEAATAVTKHGSMLGNNVVSIELVSRQVVDEARGVLSHEKGFNVRGGYRGRGFFPRGNTRRMRGGPGPYHAGSRGGGSRLPIPSESMYNPSDNLSGMEGFGNPGCILSLENVPFRAEIDEILHFFRGFNLTQNDVIRRFNDKGHPTGDVRVNLHSPLEAERALQELNKQYIRDRSINISLM